MATAPALTPAWNYTSGVYVCDACEGTGVVHAFRRATIDDPYPERPCECGQGEHEPECPVCGFDQVVQGYDCLACDTVASMHPGELARFDADAFATAIRIAIKARGEPA